LLIIGSKDLITFGETLKQILLSECGNLGMVYKSLTLRLGSIQSLKIFLIYHQKIVKKMVFGLESNAMIMVIQSKVKVKKK
jgi:hypothetical protein